MKTVGTSHVRGLNARRSIRPSSARTWERGGGHLIEARLGFGPQRARRQAPRVDVDRTLRLHPGFAIASGVDQRTRRADELVVFGRASRFRIRRAVNGRSGG